MALNAATSERGEAEIFTYESSTMHYGMNWSYRPDKGIRLATGSFVEEYNNRVEILYLDKDTQGGKLVSDASASFSHPFPPTQVAFIPDQAGNRPDLLATSGDHLRIWRISDEGTRLEKMLHTPNISGRVDGACAMTCFDWNDLDIRRISTGMTDCSVSIWDVEMAVMETQLMIHDGEVYDIQWGGNDILASASADCSVRVLDLRDKEHTTILYEPPNRRHPLIKLAWNKQDPRFMAILESQTPIVSILDIRYPNTPLVTLHKHVDSANAVCWAPHSMGYLCSAADDGQALIWDLSKIGTFENRERAIYDPILAYGAGAVINQVKWNSLHPEWVAICFENKCQILRV
eukprot:jgi/Picsp_1/4552/NSC_01922-R1_protein